MASLFFKTLIHFRFFLGKDPEDRIGAYFVLQENDEEYPVYDADYGFTKRVSFQIRPLISFSIIRPKDAINYKLNVKIYAYLF